MDEIIECLLINNDFDDNLSQESEISFNQAEEAVKASVDLEKLNSLLPKLYYANGIKAYLTKQDLLDAC